MVDDIGGIWRTVGGRRIFIKDGQDLATAMKESGKFSQKQSKTYYIDENTGLYIGRNIDGQYFGLTDNIEEAELSKKDIEKLKQSDKFFKKNNIVPKRKKEDVQKTEQIKFSEKQEIENDIFARKQGFENYKEYKVNRNLQLKEEIQQKKENFENSYVYKNANKKYDKYNNYFNEEETINSNNELYNKEVFSELIKRKASEIYNIEEVHSSAKKGSKFGDSIYLKNKDTGYEVRISNHELPETAEREYRRQQTGGKTRWDNEIILNNETMEEIIRFKTDKEFKQFIKSLFNDK